MDLAAHAIKKGTVMNTPKPTDQQGDVAASKKTQLWTGSILNAASPVPEVNTDAAKTMLGFSPSTVLVDQSGGSQETDKVIAETIDSDKVIAETADKVNADTANTVKALPTR
jgi:hypothetical protein